MERFGTENHELLGKHVQVCPLDHDAWCKDTAEDIEGATGVVTDYHLYHDADKGKAYPIERPFLVTFDKPVKNQRGSSYHGFWMKKDEFIILSKENIS